MLVDSIGLVKLGQVVQRHDLPSQPQLAHRDSNAIKILVIDALFGNEWQVIASGNKLWHVLARTQMAQPSAKLWKRGICARQDVSPRVGDAAYESVFKK